MSTIESVLQETRVFPPPAELQKSSNIPGLEAYKAMCAEPERDFEGFWAKHAKNELMWDKPFTKTLDESNAPFYKWFHDGELNASPTRAPSPSSPPAARCAAARRSRSSPRATRRSGWAAATRCAR